MWYFWLSIMSQPFFSVIIPTYNRAAFLSQSIGSVVNQSFGNWELFVVDDGSTDHTKEVVSSFKDSRIRYVYQVNSERSAARNKGIQSANGNWICFLDSDDWYHSNHLQVIFDYISNTASSAEFLFTGLEKQFNQSIDKKPFLNLNHNILIEISERFLIPSQVCIKKEVFNEFYFDERFSIWEDTHLWLRVAAKYAVDQISLYTVVQNIHSESTVTKGLKKINISSVNQYIKAITDLEIDNRILFLNLLADDFFKNYRDQKYKMYLYQARQNRQVFVALTIWFKAMSHLPSWYLTMELPKIFFNACYIGIHE